MQIIIYKKYQITNPDNYSMFYKKLNNNSIELYCYCEKKQIYHNILNYLGQQYINIWRQPYIEYKYYSFFYKINLIFFLGVYFDMRYTFF